ncbi:hypothetical protein JCM1840_007086 [Sporobolomyces johnsonii]
MSPPSPPPSEGEESSSAVKQDSVDEADPTSSSRQEPLASKFRNYGRVIENPSTEPAPQPSKRKRRSTGVRNCDQCRQSKQRCDRLRPCSNCSMRGVLCTWEEAGPDAERPSALERNQNDIARLRREVKTLSRRLGLSSRELDMLTRVADQLVEAEARPAESGSPASTDGGSKLELSIDRDGDSEDEGLGPPHKVARRDAISARGMAGSPGSSRRSIPPSATLTEAFAGRHFPRLHNQASPPAYLYSAYARHDVDFAPYPVPYPAYARPYHSPAGHPSTQRPDYPSPRRQPSPPRLSRLRIPGFSTGLVGAPPHLSSTRASLSLLPPIVIPSSSARPTATSAGQTSACRAFLASRPSPSSTCGPRSSHPRPATPSSFSAHPLTSPRRPSLPYYYRLPTPVPTATPTSASTPSLSSATTAGSSIFFSPSRPDGRDTTSFLRPAAPLSATRETLPPITSASASEGGAPSSSSSFAKRVLPSLRNLVDGWDDLNRPSSPSA